MSLMSQIQHKKEATSGQFDSKKLFEENMKYYVFNAILFTIVMNLYKPFLVNYLKLVGGNANHISFMDSVPGLVAVFTILPGTIIINMLADKQKATAIIMSLSRMMLLLFACIPFLPSALRPWMLVVLVGLRYLPESLSVSGLQSFTAEVFKPEQRTEAITTSKSYGMLIQVMVSAVTGIVITYLPKTPEQKMMAYQVFFIAAFLIGLIEVYTFMMLRKVAKDTSTESNRKAMTPRERFIEVAGVMKQIFTFNKTKRYWIFVLCSLTFHFGWQMGWSLFAIKQVEVLGATEVWRAAIYAAGSIVGFFTYRMWNVFIQKHGNSRTAFITILGMASNAFFVAISPNLIIMITLSTISGIFTSGTVTVLLNILLEVTPEDNRMVYVGLYNTIINISLCVSPLVGLAIYRATDVFVALIAVVGFRAIGGLTFYLRYRGEKKKAMSY